MTDLNLRRDIIHKVIEEIPWKVCESMKPDISSIILYGSCARGDYKDDSDIDIALLTHCDRMESKKYSNMLAEIATEMAMKYFVIVNFVCLPAKEFMEKNHGILFL